jgi:four helix bundle protein
MLTIQRFEDIESWKAARQLTRTVYDLSTHGEFAKDFSLRDQMRRAAVSVMSNIAEGFESRTRNLFADYLGRAKASCGELRAQAYVALDANCIDQQQFDTLVNMCILCSKQIHGFITYLKTKPG